MLETPESFLQSFIRICHKYSPTATESFPKSYRESLPKATARATESFLWSILPKKHQKASPNSSDSFAGPPREPQKVFPENSKSLSKSFKKHPKDLKRVSPKV